jgi:hypothetical protein
MNLTYQELADANNSTGSFLAKAANGAKDVVCGTYHDYKDFYYQNINLSSPAGALINSFWQAACPMEPSYSPPPPPFNGGQCLGVNYTVFIDKTELSTPPFKQQEAIYNVPGRIIGLRKQSTPGYGFCYLVYKLADGISRERYVHNYSGNPPFDYRITNVVRSDGQPDTCGNPPTDAPPPLAPPDKISRDITINNNGSPLTIPFSFSPKFNLPGLSINGNLNIFAPRFNFNLAPQFKLSPAPNPSFPPAPNPNSDSDLNINFDLGGVNFNLGGNQDNDTTNNNNTNNNINNINNNLNNVSNTVNNVNNTINNIDNNTDKTNDDVTIIKDKLACNPCDLLEEIKEKLNYVPVYEAFLVSEFQSIKLDNLANLGYLEIDVTVPPTKSKVIFGGNAPNVFFTGFLTWRRNGYNFAREQVTAQKTIYYAPKGTNGFSICCTHNSRASCLYYIEIKD